MIQHPATENNKLFILSFDIITGENNTAKDHRDTFCKLLCTKSWNKRFQCFNWWKAFLWLTSKKKLENQNDGAIMFFINEESEETIFEFLQNSGNIL